MTIIGLILALLLPPCPTEDSTWCSWDAAEQGNGRGSSFVTLDEGTIIYLDNKHGGW